MDERLTIEQEQEVERLLTLAHVQRMRGQIRDAEDTARKALEVSPGDVKIRQMLGDILYEEGKLDMALAEYRAVLAICPSDELLEKKFAKVTLEIGESEYQKQLAEDMIQNPHKYGGRARSPVLALISSIVPGLGQLYNGQTTKAAIIFGVNVLFWIAVAALQRYPRGIGTTAEFFYYTNPLVMLLGILAGLAWLYAIIDAPLTADKKNQALKEKSAEKSILPKV